MLKDIKNSLKSLTQAFKGHTSISFGSGVIGAGSLTGWFSGKVTAKNIIKDGYAQNSIVYACTNFVSKKLSRANWQLLRVEGNRKSHTIKAISRLSPTHPRKALLKANDATEVEQHQIVDLLDKPNEFQSSNEFFIYITAMKVLTGNAFVFKQRANPDDPTSRIARLIPLASSYVQPHYDSQGKPAGYIYSGGGLYLKISPDDMIWWSEFSADHYTLLGVSRYEAAGYSIEKSNNANISGSSMMKKGGLVGVFSQKNAGEKQAGTSRGVTQEIKEKFERDLQERGQNPHAVGSSLLTSLDLNWHPIGFKPSEMDFGEIQLEALREICRVNGLQPYIFGDTASSTYNNMQEAKKDSIMDGVIPELTGLRDTLNKDLVGDASFRGERNLMLDYDVSDFPELQDDLKKLADWLAVAWWVKPVDKQRIMNVPVDETDPVMNQYMIPKNLKGTDEVLGEESLEDILAGIEQAPKRAKQNGNGHYIVK